MNEFNSRIAAQRHMLDIINSRKWNEQLFSLASKAIDRWLVSNKIDNASKLAKLVREAGAKLFFLANKSQDQISEDYRLISQEVQEVTRQLQIAMNIHQ